MKGFAVRGVDVNQTVVKTANLYLEQGADAAPVFSNCSVMDASGKPIGLDAG